MASVTRSIRRNKIKNHVGSNKIQANWARIQEAKLRRAQK